MKSIITSRIFIWGREFVQALSPVILVTYLLLILLEMVFEGSVSAYLNLNHLLIAVIIVGVAAVLTAPKKAGKTGGERLTLKSFLLIIGAGVGGAAIVWYKTQEIGWLSYLIAPVSGALIVLLSILIWRGDEEEGNDGENRKDS